jgi:hypothetical protein
MLCNTSAGQAVALQATENVLNVPVGMKQAVWTVGNELLSSTKPLNISATATLWFGAASKALHYFFPQGLTPGGETSTPLIAEAFTEFSSIGFAYNGTSLFHY